MRVCSGRKPKGACGSPNRVLLNSPITNAQRWCHIDRGRLWLKIHVLRLTEMLSVHRPERKLPEVEHVGHLVLRRRYRASGASTPLTAQFTQRYDMLEVDVLDLRPHNEFVQTPLPEVDPAVAKALREAFLLQRYGGPIVDPEIISDQGAAHRSPAVGAQVADYSVQAWLTARATFNVVDQWRGALADAADDPVLIERVRLDGEELHSLYARRKDPAVRIVVEELGWRLKEEV
jgi:hypothetical protein